MLTPLYIKLYPLQTTYGCLTKWECRHPLFYALNVNMVIFRGHNNSITEWIIAITAIASFKGKICDPYGPDMFQNGRYITITIIMGF